MNRAVNVISCNGPSVRGANNVMASRHVSITTQTPTRSETEMGSVEVNEIHAR